MPRKTNIRGTAQEWLKWAKGNLALAKQSKPKEAFWDDVCFESSFGVIGSQISKEIWRAIDLTNYAVETRYPGPAEPVTRSEYRQAIAMAQKVVRWAESIVLPPLPKK